MRSRPLLRAPLRAIAPAALAGTLLAGAAVLGVAGPAVAAQGNPVGSIKIAAGTYANITPIEFVTDAPCPSGAFHIGKVTNVVPDNPSDQAEADRWNNPQPQLTNTGRNLYSRTQADFNVLSTSGGITSVPQSIANFFNPPLQFVPGLYDLEVFCLDTAITPITAETPSFTGQIRFTSATSWEPTEVSAYEPAVNEQPVIPNDEAGDGAVDQGGAGAQGDAGAAPGADGAQDAEGEEGGDAVAPDAEAAEGAAQDSAGPQAGTSAGVAEAEQDPAGRSVRDIIAMVVAAGAIATAAAIAFLATRKPKTPGTADGQDVVLDDDASGIDDAATSRPAEAADEETDEAADEAAAAEQPAGHGTSH